MKKTLQSSEWVLVGALLMILASLILLSKINVYLSLDKLAKNSLHTEKRFEVHISGAVQKPGKYLVDSGTPLENAIRKARPKKNADLKNMNLLEPVVASMELCIGELTEICITLSGEVECPGEIRLPAGSRICDLKSKIKLSAQADKSFFRRRKVLTDREKIVIPKKPVE